MIDASFVEAIDGLSQTPTLVEVAGRELLLKPAGWVELDPRHLDAPAVETMKLSTLTGLVDYLAANRDQLALGECQIHVASKSFVCLFGPLCAEDPRRRPVYAHVTYPGPSIFGAGRWMSPEDMVLGLQVDFVDTEQRRLVLAVVGNLREEAVRETTDDGVSQTVVARAGIARVAEVKVPNPVSLKLRCTWSEVEQPDGLYVLRMRGGSKDEAKAPQVALFHADGNALEAAAARTVASWLRTATQGLPTLLVPIPVLG